jgi:hypothetical protein
MTTAFGTTISNIQEIDRAFFRDCAMLGRWRSATAEDFLALLGIFVRAYVARGLPSAIVAYGIRLARVWRDLLTTRGDA